MELTILLLITSLLLLCLLITFLHDSSKAAVLLAAIIVIPLFLKFTESSIELGDPVTTVGPGQTFPVSVLAIMLFLGLFFLRKLVGGLRLKKSPLNMPILIFIYLNFLIFLIGFFDELRIENFLFFLQTVTPMLCFFIALNSVKSLETVKEIFLVCVIIIGSFVISLGAFAMMTEGIISTMTEGIPPYLGFLPIYQFFDYVPLVVTVGYGLGLAWLLGRVPTKGRLLLFFFLLSMLGSLFLLYSRGALLTAFLITLIQIVLFGRDVRSAKQIGVYCLVSGAMVIFLLTGQELPTTQKIRSFEDMQAEDESFAARRINFLMASQDILDNPITGLKYVTRSEDPYGRRRITFPHNQYLTYAVRGGIISLLIYLWILLLFHKRLFLMRRKASTPLIRALAVGLFSVFLGVSLISNMFQDNFIQPYSGYLLWFLMGIGEFLYLTNRKFLREGPGTLAGVYS